MAVTFDPEKQVIVNRQNRPTTVFDAQKHPVTVQPWAHVGPGGVVRNPEGTYIFVGESARHYAKFVSPQGPLYLMDRKEAEVTLGKSFHGLVGGGAVGRANATTPVGESVTSSQAKARARAVSAPAAAAPVAPVAGAAGAAAPPVTPAPAPAPAKPADAGEGPEIELQTVKELDLMPFPALREYAANWNIVGPSRQLLMDRLAAGGYIAKG